jgi:hypothetical protein
MRLHRRVSSKDYAISIGGAVPIDEQKLGAISPQRHFPGRPKAWALAHKKVAECLGRGGRVGASLIDNMLSGAAEIGVQPDSVFHGDRLKQIRPTSSS